MKTLIVRSKLGLSLWSEMEFVFLLALSGKQFKSKIFAVTKRSHDEIKFNRYKKALQTIVRLYRTSAN